MGLKSWYEAKIMPRMITCACGQGQVMKRRSYVVPLAKGDVFELGVGGPGLFRPVFDAVHQRLRNLQELLVLPLKAVVRIHQ